MRFFVSGGGVEEGGGTALVMRGARGACCGWFCAAANTRYWLENVCTGAADREVGARRSCPLLVVVVAPAGVAV